MRRRLLFCVIAQRKFINVELLLAREIGHFEKQFEPHQIAALRATGEAVALVEPNGPDKPVLLVEPKIDSTLWHDVISTESRGHNR